MIDAARAIRNNSTVVGETSTTRLSAMHMEVESWLTGRVGYGNLNAPIWFIGMEEGGGNDEEEIVLRLRGPVVEDLRDAHERIFPHGCPWFRKQRTKLQPTWRRLTLLSLAAQQKVATPDSARAYQRGVLGSSSGRELLAELFPLPSPSINRWLYGTLVPTLVPDSRWKYYAKWSSARVKLFQDLIFQFRPPVVVAYGKKHWSRYREIFSSVATWAPGPDATTITAEFVQAGAETKVLLTHHPLYQSDATWIHLGHWLRQHLSACLP